MVFSLSLAVPGHYAVFSSKDGTGGLGAVPSVLEKSRTDCCRWPSDGTLEGVEDKPLTTHPHSFTNSSSNQKPFGTDYLYYMQMHFMLDLSWRRGKRTSTYGAAAKLVMRILTCLFIYSTRTQEVE
jgi:hypothetical protein